MGSFWPDELDDLDDDLDDLPCVGSVSAATPSRAGAHIEVPTIEGAVEDTVIDVELSRWLPSHYKQVSLLTTSELPSSRATVVQQSALRRGAKRGSGGSVKHLAQVRNVRDPVTGRMLAEQPMNRSGYQSVTSTSNGKSWQVELNRPKRKGRDGLVAPKQRHKFGNFKTRVDAANEVAIVRDMPPAMLEARVSDHRMGRWTLSANQTAFLEEKFHKRQGMCSKMRAVMIANQAQRRGFQLPGRRAAQQRKIVTWFGNRRRLDRARRGSLETPSRAAGKPGTAAVAISAPENGVPPPPGLRRPTQTYGAHIRDELQTEKSGAFKVRAQSLSFCEDVQNALTKLVTFAADRALPTPPVSYKPTPPQVRRYLESLHKDGPLLVTLAAALAGFVQAVWRHELSPSAPIRVAARKAGHGAAEASTELPRGEEAWIPPYRLLSRLCGALFTISANHFFSSKKRMVKKSMWLPESDCGTFKPMPQEDLPPYHDLRFHRTYLEKLTTVLRANAALARVHEHACVQRAIRLARGALIQAVRTRKCVLSESDVIELRKGLDLSVASDRFLAFFLSVAMDLYMRPIEIRTAMQDEFKPPPNSERRGLYKPGWTKTSANTTVCIPWVGHLDGCAFQGSSVREVEVDSTITLAELHASALSSDGARVCQACLLAVCARANPEHGNEGQQVTRMGRRGHGTTSKFMSHRQLNDILVNRMNAVNLQRQCENRPLLPSDRITLYTARHSQFTTQISKGEPFAEVCREGRLDSTRVLLKFYTAHQIPNDTLGETGSQVLGLGDRATKYKALLEHLASQHAAPVSEDLVEDVLQIWAKNQEDVADGAGLRGLLLRSTPKAIEELHAIAAKYPSRAMATSLLCRAVLAENVGAVDRLTADMSPAAVQARKVSHAPYMERALGQTELFAVLEETARAPAANGAAVRPCQNFSLAVKPTSDSGEDGAEGGVPTPQLLANGALDASAPIVELVASIGANQVGVVSFRTVMAGTPTEVQDSHWPAVHAYVGANHLDITDDVWPLLIERIVAYNENTGEVLVRYRARDESDDMWLPRCPHALAAYERDARSAACFRCRREMCREVLVVYDARESCGVCYERPNASEHATWEARGAGASTQFAHRFLTLKNVAPPGLNLHGKPDAEAEALLDALFSDGEDALRMHGVDLSPPYARQVCMMMQLRTYGQHGLLDEKRATEAAKDRRSFACVLLHMIQALTVRGENVLVCPRGGPMNLLRAFLRQDTQDATTLRAKVAATAEAVVQAAVREAGAKDHGPRRLLRQAVVRRTPPAMLLKEAVDEVFKAVVRLEHEPQGRFDQDESVEEPEKWEVNVPNDDVISLALDVMVARRFCKTLDDDEDELAGDEDEPEFAPEGGESRGGSLSDTEEDEDTDAEDGPCAEEDEETDAEDEPCAAKDEETDAEDEPCAADADKFELPSNMADVLDEPCARTGAEAHAVSLPAGQSQDGARADLPLPPAGQSQDGARADLPSNCRGSKQPPLSTAPGRKPRLCRNPRKIPADQPRSSGTLKDIRYQMVKVLRKHGLALPGGHTPAVRQQNALKAAEQRVAANLSPLTDVMGSTIVVLAYSLALASTSLTKYHAVRANPRLLRRFFDALVDCNDPWVCQTRAWLSFGIVRVLRVSSLKSQLRSDTTTCVVDGNERMASLNVVVSANKGDGGAVGMSHKLPHAAACAHRFTEKNPSGTGFELRAAAGVMCGACDMLRWRALQVSLKVSRGAHGREFVHVDPPWNLPWILGPPTAMPTTDLLPRLDGLANDAAPAEDPAPADNQVPDDAWAQANDKPASRVRAHLALRSMDVNDALRWLMAKAREAGAIEEEAAGRHGRKLNSIERVPTEEDMPNHQLISHMLRRTGMWLYKQVDGPNGGPLSNAQIALIVGCSEKNVEYYTRIAAESMGTVKQRVPGDPGRELRNLAQRCIGLFCGVQLEDATAALKCACADLGGISPYSLRSMDLIVLQLTLTNGASRSSEDPVKVGWVMGTMKSWQESEGSQYEAQLGMVAQNEAPLDSVTTGGDEYRTQLNEQLESDRAPSDKLAVANVELNRILKLPPDRSVTPAEERGMKELLNTFESRVPETWYS